MLEYHETSIPEFEDTPKWLDDAHEYAKGCFMREKEWKQLIEMHEKEGIGSPKSGKGRSKKGKRKGKENEESEERECND